MAESEICLRENDSRLLVHPDYQDEVTGAWFDPEYWGDRACPVSSGGRGGAWFISSGDHRLVLREYRRGGLMAKVSRNTYVFTGESSVRSFAEFRLLNQLIFLGLPVPRPVAASYRRLSPIRYRAAIIIEQIEGATPLAELLQAMDDEAWESLGRTVRKFHDAGVMHADLNCFNVLVRDDKFFLIDFDKGAIKPASSVTGWKDHNLSRLHRSLVKVSSGESLFLQQGWQSFLAGYGQSY
jgi:3-deoxy-D-manno-octulosonic acid kinase